MNTPPTLEAVYSDSGIDAPQKMVASHPGEHHGDHGTMKISITRSTYIYAMCAAVNSCNLGFDIGVNTNAGVRIQKDFGLSNVQVEVLIGSINFWSMFGALGAHYICDRYGRRRSFIVAAIGFIVGVIIMASAWTYWVLMFGRVFVGLGVGFGLAIDPLYISEISSAAHRGELVTWSEFAINVGIVFGFAAGFIPGDDGWRYMFLLGAILPVVMIFLVLYVMPETPRWLIVNQRETEAREILAKVYPDGYNVDPVMEDIKESIERDATAEKEVGWDIIWHPTPAFRRMLWVGIGSAIAQQAVGIDAIQYFLIDILDRSGVQSQNSQTRILIFLGLVKLFFVYMGGKLFDRSGRRPLLFASLIGMAIALILVAINFFGSSVNAGFGVFALSLYLASFSIGIGPGAWLIPAEVFSTIIRAKAMSLATFCNRVTATLMASTFLSTADAISYSGFFILLAVICAIVLIFLYHLLPETKGRSLEDMSLYFAEITGDRSILKAEAKIMGERRAQEGGVELRSANLSSLQHRQVQAAPDSEVI